MYHLTDTSFSALEESSSSGSDYEEQQEVKKRARHEKADKGHLATDTEVDDANLDRELLAEAVPEVETPTQPKKKTQRKRPGPSGDAVISSEEQEEGEHPDSWLKVSGPLPKAARVEAQQLAALVTQEAEKIARKYQKNTREVILAAGLGVRAARTRNPFNMFKKWYAHHNPNKDCECL